MSKNSGGMGGMKTVLAWTIGVAIIALVLLIFIILFGNLVGNTGISRTSAAFTQETINLTNGSTGNIPEGAQGLINAAIVPSSIIMTNATNGTEENILNSDNYTLATGGTRINVTGTSDAYAFSDELVNVSYTVTYDAQGQIDADNLIFNYTKGAVNTSTQFPVVGTIIGVALLLLVLIGVLVFAITKLGGVSVQGKSFGGSNSSDNFGGSESSSIA